APTSAGRAIRCARIRAAPFFVATAATIWPSISAPMFASWQAFEVPVAFGKQSPAWRLCSSRRSVAAAIRRQWHARLGWRDRRDISPAPRPPDRQCRSARAGKAIDCLPQRHGLRQSRHRDELNDLVVIAAAPPMGIAITLDQALAFDNFNREFAGAGSRLHDQP